MTEVVAQVKALHKQLELLRGQSSKFETCAVTAEERTMMVDEEVSLLKQELLKRLKERTIEAVESFQSSEAFEMKAAMWSRDALVVACRNPRTFLMSMPSFP